MGYLELVLSQVCKFSPVESFWVKDRDTLVLGLLSSKTKHLEEEIKPGEGECKMIALNHPFGPQKADSRAFGYFPL